MKNLLTCIIIDDEPLAQNVLEEFIGRLSFLSLIRTCNHAYEAIEAIHEHKPDLAFLDITMPEMTGLELLKTFTTARPQIIVTTAHPQYAVEGFEYSVTDYLLKPISFDRFLRAVNKVKDKLTAPDDLKTTASPDDTTSSPAPPAKGRFFWIREGKKLVQIDAEQVIYVEGMKDYVKVYLPDKMIVTYLTMQKMEELLPLNLFIRVNRSYIVRRSAIRSVNGNTIETTTKQEIPIGGKYRDTVKEVLRESFIGRAELD